MYFKTNVLLFEVSHKKFYQIDRPINDENYEHEFHKINSPITYDRSTSLTIVHEFQFKIQPEYLKGVVIENRYLVQDTLGDGFTGFVRSGKFKVTF